MKFMKASALFVLAVLFLGAFIPEASARHCKKRSSFGLSFNVGGPGYVVAPAPAPVVAAPVYPVYPPYPTYQGYVPGTVYYGAPVYGAPVYGAPVEVVRPAAPVYVEPGFSFSYKNRHR